MGDGFWRPLFSPSSMAPKDYDPLPEHKDKADSLGVAGIRIAPSNKDIIFAVFCGYVWRSADGGRTVQRTRFPQKRFNPNGGWQRLFNPTVDIHPVDPSSVLVGTWGEGAWCTADGGATWRQADLPPAEGTPDGQEGIHLVAFDPAQPNRVYVFVAGLGLFRSDTGPGGKFDLLAGGPTRSSNIVPGPGGDLFVCEFSKDRWGGKVWRYSPMAGWTSAQPKREAMTLAFDPRKPGTALLVNADGVLMKSDDFCATFAELTGWKWAENGGEIQWMGGLSTMYPAQVKFDPNVPGQAWIAQGVGVASANIDDPAIRVQDWSAGIEELCAWSTLCVPGGKTYLAAMDKPFWRVDSLSAYTNDFRFPVLEGNGHNADFVAFATWMDYAPEDPRFLVGVVAPGQWSGPGYTTNGGESWKVFSGQPEGGWGKGGCIAAASKTNFVVLPSNNAPGVYTLDGGKSWATIKLDGKSPTTGFANAFYVGRKNLSADKSRPGTFALVFTTLSGNDEYLNVLGGLWLSRDGGRSWTQQLAGLIGPPGTKPREVAVAGGDARQFWQCQLEYVPGRSGELVYTPHADLSADRFFWSQDDGKTWAELHKSIRNVRAFGFGKAAPGQARPSLFFWGEVRGRQGLFASFDWLASEPRLVSRFPSQMLANVSCIGGDLNNFGRVYVGTSCAGWVRVDVEA
ncbi:hypothetical protein [Sphingomonas humi]|uniref:WD40/YVTN/BNR-like repeat-containing protein n=1 Tax=Sphingomonas humi TaxID=335630 RepID=UPI0031D8736F